MHNIRANLLELLFSESGIWNATNPMPEPGPACQFRDNSKRGRSPREVAIPGQVTRKSTPDRFLQALIPCAKRNQSCSGSWPRSLRGEASMVKTLTEPATKKHESIDSQHATCLFDGLTIRVVRASADVSSGVGSEYWAFRARRISRTRFQR